MAARKRKIAQPKQAAEVEAAPAVAESEQSESAGGDGQRGWFGLRRGR